MMIIELIISVKHFNPATSEWGNLAMKRSSSRKSSPVDGKSSRLGRESIINIIFSILRGSDLKLLMRFMISSLKKGP